MWLQAANVSSSRVKNTQHIKPSLLIWMNTYLKSLHNPPFPVFAMICLFTTLVPQDVCCASRAIVLPDVNFDALANTFGIIAHESTPICPIWSLWLGPCRPSVIETLRDSARQVNKWEDCSLQKQCHYIFSPFASELICMTQNIPRKWWTLSCPNNDTASMRGRSRRAGDLHQTHIIWLEAWICLTWNPPYNLVPLETH